MKDLSIGANIAWQIAAYEAAAAKFQFIEKEHLFIGICSLEKILKLSTEDSGLTPESFKALQKEYAEIQIPLSSLILSGKIKEQRALNVILRNEEIQIIPIDEET